MEEKQNAENKMSKQGIDSVKSNSDFRTKKIIQTSIAGIVTNILLAVFKAVIGIMTNSIAIVLDAVNNASDVASSVVTIAGTKLSKKEPDKAHPFGHGRIEYLSAMIIAVIILYAGITSAVEAVKKIITPDIPSYSTVPLIIVAVAVVVKIVLGRYVKTVGVMVKSDSLINSGIDASMDAVISAATLVAAVIYLNFNISVEAYLGVIISIFIIKAGIDLLRETLFQILLTRKIAVAVYEKHNVVLTAIGIYSLNSTDKLAVQIKDTIEELVMMNPYILQMHGFYFNKEEASIRFDLVVSFEAKDRRQVYEYVVGKIQKHYPEYKVEAVMDTEYSDVTDNK